MELIFYITALSSVVLVFAQHDHGHEDASGHGGYSFSKFSGPVSGPIHEVAVKHEPHITHEGHGGHGEHYGHAVDYVAKPDYKYAYGVEDPHKANYQNHEETRDGDIVKGEYSLMEPDGTLRVVKYTADSKNGFQATVIRSGDHHGGQEVSHHGNNDDYHNEEGGQHDDYY